MSVELSGFEPLARVPAPCFCKCPLMAQSRHTQYPHECPLLGVKRTLTNRCLQISIYEYTA